MKIRKISFSLLAVACLGSAQAALLTEGFDSVAGLAGAGWVLTNNSVPAGNDWFQGNSGVFGSQAGAPSAYVGADFLSTSGINGVVDNWLISPVLALGGGGTLTFFTRTADPGFSDKLEVRFSAGGSASTASFTTLLRTIGDAATPYPDTDWQTFSVTLPAQASGRFAFRYTVGDAINADYIGIDSVSVDAGVNSVPEPAGYALFGVGALALVALGRRRSAATA